MSLKTRARRIEDVKRKKLLRTVRAPTSILKFPYSRDLDLQNVSRLKKLFENGQCLPHHPDYSIPAIIEDRDGLSPEWFQTENGQKYEAFTPPEGYKLVCLRGQHRVKAAEELLYGTVTWLIQIYRSDISDEVRQDLIDKYDSEKPPDDGEFYYHIRLYSGKWDWTKRDAILEDHWWARWRSLPRNKEYGGEHDNKGKREADPLYRLLRNEDWVSALDRFLPIKALLSGLKIGSTAKMITLGHSFEVGLDTNSFVQRVPADQQELPLMVRRIATWWYTVFDNDFGAMACFDKNSLAKLHGTAPGASEQQRTRLQRLAESGDILGAFESTKRAEYFSNLCIGSQTFLVPSLDLLVKNLQYLGILRDSFARLVTFNNRSLRSVLRQDFVVSENFEETEECKIQVDESNVIATHVNDDPFELAYLQLWLFVFRNFVSMPKMEEPKKAGIKRDQADKLVLHNFALVAHKLGFRTAKIEQLRNQDPDISIADDVMVAARQEPYWFYPNRDTAVRSIAGIFRSAKRSEIEPVESYRRGGELLPNIYGRPHDVHHHHDRVCMFLPYMHSKAEPQKGKLSSIFIAQSLYFWLLDCNVRTDLSLDVKPDLIPVHTFGATTFPEAQAEQTAEKLQLAKDAQVVRDDNDRLIQKEKELLQKIGQLEEQIIALEKEGSRRLSEKAEELAQMKAQIQNQEQLRGTIRELEGQIRNLNEEGSTLLTASSAKDEELSTLKAQIQEQDKLLQEIRNLKEQIDGLKEEGLAVLGDEHRQLLEEKQMWLTENEQLQARGEQQSRENKELEERAAVLKEGIKEMEDEARRFVKSTYTSAAYGRPFPVANALQDINPGNVEAASRADPDLESSDDDDDSKKAQTMKLEDGQPRVRTVKWEDGQPKIVKMLGRQSTIDWATRMCNNRCFLYCFDTKGGGAKQISDPDSSYDQAIQCANIGNNMLLATNKHERQVPSFTAVQRLLERHPWDWDNKDEDGDVHIRPTEHIKYKRVKENHSLPDLQEWNDPEQVQLELLKAKQESAFVHGNDEGEAMRRKLVNQRERAESSRWVKATPQFPSNK